MECQYCKNTYSNVYTLKNHQINTKACIMIQKEHGKIAENKVFECSYCKKNLSSKARLLKHYICCKLKIKEDKKKEFEEALEQKAKQIVEEKQDELEEVVYTFRNEKEELEYELGLKNKIIKDNEIKIKELQERLDKHEKTPKVINKNKNITNNINILTINEVMTPERVEEFFKKHYNLDTLMQGMSGLAKFICDGFIREKASYYCTDRSRHKFIMSDLNGGKMEDPNCEKLASLTGPGLLHVKDIYETELFNQHEDITEEEIHESYEPISKLDKDTTKLSNELSKIVPSSNVPSETVPVQKKSMSLSEVCELMRSSQTKLRERKKDNTSVKSNTTTEPIVDPVTPPELQTIGGFSLGQLHRYREGYKKRKAASGCDVEIKGPASLLELCKTDKQVKTQYETYIMS